MVTVIFMVLSFALRAESQGMGDYKGIIDPFGDPANYEFAEEEQEAKEFFHLGRYLMIGVDLGVGIFTGGLGKTTDPGFYVGGRLLYFFDRILALEMAVHYSSHLDLIKKNDGTSADVETTLIPITAGLRYYFDTRNAPKAIAIANPYLAFGGGMYLRNQNPLRASGLNVEGGDGGSFGFYPGAGLEFNIYRRHIYLGADVRYHWIFFNDEEDTFSGGIEEGGRAGDYFTSTLTLTYSF